VRIALDSSVLIAAHISRAGVCAELLEDLLLHHELVTSDFILEELGRKLLEKFNYPIRDTAQATGFIRRCAIVVSPKELDPSLCRDPTDLLVLGTAVAGECALLISVDRDLLDMQNVHGIPIIRPGEYWRHGSGEPSAVIRRTRRPESGQITS
jgi:putative PIN family toxin of toxin-antitoxin system